ncbi:MAG: hypothetical protein ACREHV_00120, partial [Rhizomicrobium sp.]
LEGFRFAPDPRTEGMHGRTLRAVALKALEGEYYSRARKLAAADDSQISLSEHGRVWWDGAIVAHLARGPSALEPNVVLLCDEQLKPELRESSVARLRAWIGSRIDARVAPLIALRRAADAKPGSPDALPAAARGVAHQLCEALGSLDRRQALLPPDLRVVQFALGRFGVRFGRHSIFLPSLLRPNAAGLLALLSGVWSGADNIPAPPPPGITSFEPDPWLTDGFLAAAGFRRLAGRAVRLDILERLENTLEAGVHSGASSQSLLGRLVSLLGSNAAALEATVAGMGWTKMAVGTAPTYVWRRSASRRNPLRKTKAAAAAPQSPFAELSALIAAD